jgi:hypothetical protein
MGRLAHERSRSMTWWNVADQYRTLLARVQASPARGRTSYRSIALQT